jgi:hypothetical protein
MSLVRIDHPTTEGPLSLPDQSQKSRTSLSEMSLLEHKISNATGDGRSVSEFRSLGLKAVFAILYRAH